MNNGPSRRRSRAKFERRVARLSKEHRCHSQRPGQRHRDGLSEQRENKESRRGMKYRGRRRIRAVIYRVITPNVVRDTEITRAHLSDRKKGPRVSPF